MEDEGRKDGGWWSGGLRVEIWGWKSRGWRMMNQRMEAKRMEDG
jgi:hypothetical protein